MGRPVQRRGISWSREWQGRCSQDRAEGSRGQCGSRGSKARWEQGTSVGCGGCEILPSCASRPRRLDLRSQGPGSLGGRLRTGTLEPADISMVSVCVTVLITDRGDVTQVPSQRNSFLRREWRPCKGVAHFGGRTLRW